MNKSDKLIFQMNILNNIIKATEKFKDNEPITPKMLRDILRETKSKIENELVNL